MSWRHWEKEFEERDKNGNTVTNVIYLRGKPWAYMSVHNHEEYASHDVESLIPKPKSKKRRPWRLDEVPVGLVIRHKNGAKVLITGAMIDYGETKISTNGWCAHVAASGWKPAKDVLEQFTRMDGSPCGVEE